MVPIDYHADMHALRTTNNRMDRATLPSIPWIRTLDNEVIGDILYYFSTYHGHEMLALVIGKLNAAYTNFISTHPGFQGPISLIAHSLGGLVCYEILYYMRRLEEAKAKGVDVGDLVNPRERERYHSLPALAFRPDRLFSMGTPMGATLVFRNLTFAEYLIPASVGYHNIFHPYDPFGYRTEPLVDDFYEDTPAVPITAEDVLANNVVAKPGNRRMTLGGSMADLGKTFVDAMTTAPASFSSTVIRAARTSVTVPIIAIMGNKGGGRDSVHETRHHHRRKLSLFGSSTSSLASEGLGRRRHSLSKLLPSLKSFSFGGSRRSSPSASGDLAHASQSNSSSQSAIAEEEQPPSDKKPAAGGASTPESSLSFSCTSQVAATISAIATESPAQDPAPHASSATSSDPEEETDDAMLTHIMRIFKVDRAPTREQQIAEAQGLPLSSRLVVGMQNAQRVGGMRATTTAPHEFVPGADSRPVRSAHGLSNGLSSESTGSADLSADAQGVPALRRYSTMPPVCPLVENARAAVEEASTEESPASPPPAPEHAAKEEVEEEEEDGAAAKLAHRLPYTERMDYIIPFSKGHLQNEYWLGFQAHFSYWTSKDVVHHILYHMVRKPISSKP